ncbi:MAG: hypothetical protein AVDCRST_MAG34-2323 [uncultured Nocardioidaceae bacterium]|uniref:Uncharacterized protein n=1 Tax=uncultured Nocardioidaceae bacterium TaxID=253824 RepID=A0A6J4MJG0_9ACTN|nr:MAG: hypothetical protein AVDCRST_MAG34-2323 [uncultured Nocardioidaceae bacterium]
MHKDTAFRVLESVEVVADDAVEEALTKGVSSRVGDIVARGLGVRSRPCLALSCRAVRRGALIAPHGETTTCRWRGGDC